ncbi:MAG: ParA family protein [Caldilineaceae bacterium]
MIVEVASQKGGAGKTTAAVNLGHGLARRNHLVLLVDRDPQLNTLDALGLRTLAESAAPAPGIYETKRTGLHLFPAGAEDVDLTALAEQYDLVVVDTAPDQFLQRTTLPYADIVIIPAQCFSLGVRGALLTLDVIRQISQPRYTYVLPTMYDGSAEHDAHLELLADLPGAEAAPYIPKNNNIPKGQGKGRTIYEGGGRGMHAVCEKYDYLVDWIEQAMHAAGQRMDLVTLCH